MTAELILVALIFGLFPAGRYLLLLICVLYIFHVNH